MRRIPALAALALLVLTGGCLGAFAGTQNARSTDAAPAQGAQAAPADNTTIDVSASGQVTAEPDQAVVRVAVVARGPDAATARQRLAANVSSMRAGLREAGIPQSAVTTSGYDLSQEYQRPDSERNPDYVARQSFEIRLNDTNRTGTAIDAAVENGATQVDGVRFTLSDERREQLRQEALAAAMEQARQRATTIATSANLTVVGVQRVSSVQRSYGPVYAEATAVAADGGGATTIDSGPVTVTAQVNVRYEAEE